MTTPRGPLAGCTRVRARRAAPLSAATSDKGGPPRTSGNGDVGGRTATGAGGGTRETLSRRTLRSPLGDPAHRTAARASSPPPGIARGAAFLLGAPVTWNGNCPPSLPTRAPARATALPPTCSARSTTCATRSAAPASSASPAHGLLRPPPRRRRWVRRPLRPHCTTRAFAVGDHSKRAARVLNMRPG